MLRPLPDAAKLEVAPALARALLRAAESLPVYRDKDFYSTALQEEICAALRTASGDGFDDLVDEIRNRLAIEPHAVLLSGLTFDSGNRLFVGLNRAFGRLVAPPYQAPRAQLVHYIQPATDIKAVRQTTHRTESERFHTDCADWPEPARIVSMVCVRPDPHGGGRSLVLDTAAIHQEVEERLGRDIVKLLERESVPWKTAKYRGGDVIWQPILGSPGIRWRRYTIDAALSEDGVEISPDLAEILDPLGELIDRSDRSVDFLMAAGELLFVDNHRALHARTPLDGSYKSSERLMLRSWIQTDAAAPPQEEGRI